MPSWPSMVVGEAVRQSVVKLFVSYASHPVSQPCHPVEHAVLGQSCALASDLLVFSVSSLGPLLVGIVRSHMGHSVGQRVPNGPRMMYPSNNAKPCSKLGRSPNRHPTPPGVFTAPAGVLQSTHLRNQSFGSDSVVTVRTSRSLSFSFTNYLACCFRVRLYR